MIVEIIVIKDYTILKKNIKNNCSPKLTRLAYYAKLQISIINILYCIPNYANFKLQKKNTNF